MQLKMKFNNKRSAIILPLKENFSNQNFIFLHLFINFLILNM